MKSILLYIVLFLAGCNQVNRNAESKNFTQSDSLKIEPRNFAETTALPVAPLRKFPSSFELDSLSFQDTTVHFAALIYFPKSKEDDQINKSIKQFIEHQVNLEKPESRIGDATSFDMWITDLKVSKRLLYFLFRQQSFTTGAAHYNHSYLTWNYDLIRKRKVSFTDIFKFSSNKKKQMFCNQLNGYFNGVDDADGYNGGLVPQDISSYLNYAVWNQQLIIYPNECCATEDKIYTIDLRLVQEYIDPVLGKDFGLIISEKSP